MPTFAVGDVHGQLEPLVRLLRDAGLVTGDLSWCGGDARLWFMGDLVDRGPDGVPVIDLVMRLQQEGDVRCLLGNHEAGLLGTHRFGALDCVPGVTFREVWEQNGGITADLARLRPEHLAWIERLPAVARDGEWLLVHSDTERYVDYGSSVAEVCASIAGVLTGAASAPFGRLLEILADRGGYEDPSRLDRLRAVLGGERVAHGHTPIWYALGSDPDSVTAPLSYAGGRALNVDHSLYAGGPGFVAELA